MSDQEPQAKFIRNGNACSVVYSFPNDEAWDNEERVEILLDVFMKAAGATVNEIQSLDNTAVEQFAFMMKQKMQMPASTPQINN